MRLVEATNLGFRRTPPQTRSPAIKHNTTPTPTKTTSLQGFSAFSIVAVVAAGGDGMNPEMVVWTTTVRPSGLLLNTQEPPEIRMVSLGVPKQRVPGRRWTCWKCKFCQRSVMKIPQIQGVQNMSIVNLHCKIILKKLNRWYAMVSERKKKAIFKNTFLSWYETEFLKKIRCKIYERMKTK